MDDKSSRLALSSNHLVTELAQVLDYLVKVTFWSPLLSFEEVDSPEPLFTPAHKACFLWTVQSYKEPGSPVERRSDQIATSCGCPLYDTIISVTPLHSLQKFGIFLVTVGPEQHPRNLDEVALSSYKV